VRAATILGPQELALRRAEPPEPGYGEVRIRLEGCGVCGSNLPSWDGRPWFQYPLAPGAPGHEGWGVVDAVGPGVSAARLGERVGALSYNAFAEYDLARSDALVRLPRELCDGPFPAEPLGCAMNVLRRCAIQAGQFVAVVGVGFLGALLVQLAARAGARVIAISRRRFALEVAEAAGATEIIRLDNLAAAVRQVWALTGEAGCERVIEAVGEQPALDLAAEITAERGRLIIAGYHQDGLRQVNMQLWNWRGLDVINAHERAPEAYRQGMQMAVEAVARGDLDPAPLITHDLPLADLPRAFELMRTRPDGFLKAVVRP
jgi:threonine dehydrogenase-like Zn-dependent dehydrogenase